MKNTIIIQFKLKIMEKFLTSKTFPVKKFNYFKRGEKEIRYTAF